MVTNRRGTLAQLLASESVDFDRLGEDYRPMLRLVRELIGVVPNCDPYLEIWPPGFRTYNLAVANFLNLPALLFGRSAPKDLVGLAMYTSSRAANCMYCSAHMCSFALRRGASADAITGAQRTPTEIVVAEAAEALSTIPATFGQSHLDAMRAHLDDDDIEWIVLSVGLTGFLNKFMDAAGIELEPEALADVTELIGPTGWTAGQHLWTDELVIDLRTTKPPTDSIGTYARVAREGRAATRLEKTWTDGLPQDPENLRIHIAHRYGFDEPLLPRMRHRKAARALAAILRENLDPGTSEIGLSTKVLAGLVYASTIGSERLARQLEDLAANLETGSDDVRIAKQFSVAPSMIDLDTLTDKEVAALRLARAIAPSPARVPIELVASTAAVLSASEVIETVVWISVLQVLHRLGSYFDAAQ